MKQRLSAILLIICSIALVVVCTAYAAPGVNPTAAITPSDSTLTNGQVGRFTFDFSKPMTDTAGYLTRVHTTGSFASDTTITMETSITGYIDLTPSSTATTGDCTITLSNGLDCETGTIETTPTSGEIFSIDASTPTVTSITWSDRYTDVGQTVRITALFDEEMTTSVAAKFTLAGENTVTATDMTWLDTTHAYIDHTVITGEGTMTASVGTAQDIGGKQITTDTATGFINQQTADTTANNYAGIAAAFTVGALGASLIGRKRRSRNNLST